LDERLCAIIRLILIFVAVFINIMAKTPPKPTGDKKQNLINLYNHGYKWNKVGALIRLMHLKK